MTPENFTFRPRKGFFYSLVRPQKSMHISQQIWAVLIIAFGVLALFNLYVSIRLLIYGGYSSAQKAAQLSIVWLLPIMGALFVHSVMVVPHRVKKDPGFTEDGGDNPPGIGTAGHY